MSSCAKGPNITREEFEKLPPVRVWSPVGPCLTFYRLWKENKKTYTLVFWNGDRPAYERVPKFKVHTEPCTSCTDHPQTMYPNGYMD